MSFPVQSRPIGLGSEWSDELHKSDKPWCASKGLLANFGAAMVHAE